MQDLNQHLIELADRLDAEGKTVCADIVDGLIKSESLTKVAQYVGVIGYVLKQNRAMGNCMRKKRAQSDRPMQTIVLECLKEYQDSQGYQDTKWHSKYAESIASRPKDFDKLHLSLLKEMSKEEHLDKHINNVEAAAVSLYERGVKDAAILTVLSHVEELGELLRKDSEVTQNFKFAAPPSPRNRWSRFWTPSQFSWSNPFSWRGRWQRGEDKDVMLEMENVLKNIRSITHISQQMKTNIHRLKNQVGGYLSGSHENLPDPESQKTIQTVSQKINQLDSDNWNKNILATQQLRHLLNSNSVQNSYNKEHINLAISLADSLYRDTNRVYEYINHIQQDMNDMRQRAPIRGRDVGLTETGEENPFGKISPANEFGVLERVLSRLYENPFDEKAHFYAQKMHARLDDKLRYIENEDDPEADEWLKNPREPMPPVSTQNPETSPDQSSSDVQEQVNPQSENQPVSEDKIKDAVQDLLSIPGTMNEQSKPEYIARILNTIFSHYSDKGRDPTINSLIEALLSVKNNESEETRETPTNTMVSAPPSPAQVVKNPINTEAKPEQEVEQTIEPKENISPVLENNTEINIPKVENQQTRSRRSKSRRSAKNRGPIPSQAGNVLRNLPEFDESSNAIASIFDVIKIADVLDKRQPELATIVDEYIKDHTELIFEIPEFPNIGKVIKEDQANDLKNK